MGFDIVFTNAMIVDGTGAPAYSANVAVQSDKIAAITQELPGAEQVIDAQGKVLSPGFIDMHSHSEFVLLRDDHFPLMAPFIKQGITTLIGGNCGFAPAPIFDETVPFISNYTRFLSGTELDWSWRGFADFLNTLEERGTALNIGCLAAHGISRMAVMGFEGRPASPAEISGMQKQVSEALEQGALGLSAGLMYAPGMFSDTQELIEVAQPLAGSYKPFTFHLRGLSETFLNSLAEAISIGAAQDIPVQVSHFCVGGTNNWALSEQGLEKLEKSRKRGVNVGLDMFPYTWANTTISALFPRWALRGGLPALIQRLSEPAARERIERDIESVVPQWPHWEEDSWSDNIVRNAGGWDGVILTVFSHKPRPEFVGKSIAEIAEMEGKRPFDTIADLVIEQNGQILMLCGGWSGNDQSDDPLWEILLHPLTAIETDAIVLDEEYPHPATYGTFPAFLDRAIRLKEHLALERAVNKCTGLPAERMGLRDRGYIRSGCYADLVLFDPEKIGCAADARNPRLEPKGIEYVIMNGKLIVKQGEFISRDLHGQVIRAT